MASFNIDKPIVEYKTRQKPKEPKENVIVTDVKLPADAPARMKTLKAEGKKWYLTVVYHADGITPFALFCTTNNREKSAQTHDAVDRLVALAQRKGILREHIDKLVQKMEHDTNVGKLTRIISMLLRHRVSIVNIVAELDRMDIFIGSFLFQIKKFLSGYVQDGTKIEGMVCSNCGSTSVVYSEGCSMCVDCGSSKCG